MHLLNTPLLKKKTKTKKILEGLITILMNHLSKDFSSDIR